MGADAAAWTIALVFANVLRYEFELRQVRWGALLIVILGVVLLQYVIGWANHLYRGRFWYGSFEEVRALTLTAVLTGLVAAVPLLYLGTSSRVPRSVIFIATPIALVAMLGTRYVRRLQREHRSRPAASAPPVLVFGAGSAGSQLVRALTRDTAAPFRVVGMLDDDRILKNAQVRDVRVLGTLADLERVVARTRAQAIIVAIARADASRAGCRGIRRHPGQSHAAFRRDPRPQGAAV